MRLSKLLFLIALFYLSSSLSLFAADSTDTNHAMPPMGPPAEIKAMSNLIGTWDVKSEFKMLPTDTAWMSSTAVSVYSWGVGGTVLHEIYKSQFMGMAFEGFLTLAYDRETKMYQSTWIDNMSAKIAYYTGSKIDGKLVFSGKGLYQGQMVHSRITTWNMKEGSFQWLLEQSMDGGKTYHKMGKATYKKRK